MYFRLLSKTYFFTTAKWHYLPEAWYPKLWISESTSEWVFLQTIREEKLNTQNFEFLRVQVNEYFLQTIRQEKLNTPNFEFLRVQVNEYFLQTIRQEKLSTQTLNFCDSESTMTTSSDNQRGMVWYFIRHLVLQDLFFWWTFGLNFHKKAIWDHHAFGAAWMTSLYYALTTTLQQQASVCLGFFLHLHYTTRPQAWDCEAGEKATKIKTWTHNFSRFPTSVPSRNFASQLCHFPPSVQNRKFLTAIPKTSGADSWVILTDRQTQDMFRGRQGEAEPPGVRADLLFTHTQHVIRSVPGSRFQHSGHWRLTGMLKQLRAQCGS